MCLPVKPYKIEREWEHLGLKCAVVQAREAQHRCGYVRVPPGHPYYGKPWDETAQLEVHGGITFAVEEPCIEEDGKGWWFGFDCTHSGDASYDPNVDVASVTAETQELLRIFFKVTGDPSRVGLNQRGDHFWTQAEVERETERLAEQLVEAANEPV